MGTFDELAVGNAERPAEREGDLGGQDGAQGEAERLPSGLPRPLLTAPRLGPRPIPGSQLDSADGQPAFPPLLGPNHPAPSVRNVFFPLLLRFCACL